MAQSLYTCNNPIEYHPLTVLAFRQVIFETSAAYNLGEFKEECNILLGELTFPQIHTMLENGIAALSNNKEHIRSDSLDNIDLDDLVDKLKEELQVTCFFFFGMETIEWNTSVTEKQINLLKQLALSFTSSGNCLKYLDFLKESTGSLEHKYFTLASFITSDFCSLKSNLFFQCNIGLLDEIIYPEINSFSDVLLAAAESLNEEIADVADSLNENLLMEILDDLGDFKSIKDDMEAIAKMTGSLDDSQAQQLCRRMLLNLKQSQNSSTLHANNDEKEPRLIFLRDKKLVKVFISYLFSWRSFFIIDKLSYLKWKILEVYFKTIEREVPSVKGLTNCLTDLGHGRNKAFNKGVLNHTACVNQLCKKNQSDHRNDLEFLICLGCLWREKFHV